MRKLFVLLMTVVIGSSVGVCAAQETVTIQGPTIEGTIVEGPTLHGSTFQGPVDIEGACGAGVPPVRMAPPPSVQACGCGPCGVAAPRCCSCRHSAPCCNHAQLTTLMAHVGNFNCGCRGSYKFPVPPQYTYHWPGMYSQPYMTAYSSPWRFPSLRLYQNQLVRARDVSNRMVWLGPPPR